MRDSGDPPGAQIVHLFPDRRNVGGDRPADMDLLERHAQRMRELAIERQIPSQGDPAPTRVFVEAGRRGEGVVYAVADQGRLGAELARLHLPSRGARPEDLLADAAWRRLLERLARRAGGALTIETAAGVPYTLALTSMDVACPPPGWHR